MALHVPDYILETRGVSKRYNAVVALDDVSIHIRRGTIHGLLGENGAGKSTLVGLIAGLVSPTRGQVLYAGEEVQGNDVKTMESHGVFLVTQEPMIVGEMSVADNLMLGHWPVKRGLLGVVDEQALRANALTALDGTGLDPRMPAASLSAVQKRKLNILRALFSGGKLLILDEPTASLTLEDRDHLFEFMRSLKADGVSFIFISHYNEEILGICDGVSVLRNGQLAGEIDGLDEIDSQALSELVVGRDVPLFYRERAPLPTEGRWMVSGLRADGIAIDEFTIKAGEIVGFAGMPGSGAREFALALFGLNRATAGVIARSGRTIVPPDHPEEAFRVGIAYLSDDRHRDGLVGLQSIANNITLSSLGRLSRAGVIDADRERRIVQRYFTHLQVKADGAEVAVSTLSGGNQQKVCLGRVLAAEPNLLILDEPTRGIDVGVKEEVHRIIDTLTRTGLSVIVITSDVDELVRIADRVCIFADGSIKRAYVGNDLNREVLLHAAFGCAVAQ